MNRTLWIGTIAVTLCSFATAQASMVVLNDTFDSPSYDSFSFNGDDDGTNPDDVSSESFDGTSSPGGNPGSFGIIRLSYDVSRDEFGEPLNGDGNVNLQSFFSDLTTTYIPSIQGEIESINFSLDVRTIDPLVTDVFFEISDPNGGSVANGSLGGAFQPITADGTWQTYVLTGVMQDGATNRDFAGSDPLSFGFGFLSFEDVFQDPIDSFIDVDNFVVEVTLVPEPASMALLGLGCLLIAGRRRAS